MGNNINTSRQTLGECQSGEPVAIMRLFNAQRSFWCQLKGAGQSDKPELERNTQLEDLIPRRMLLSMLLSDLVSCLLVL